MDGSGAGTSYALGHSDREISRLSTQARMFEPFTRRMLEQAGVAPGMRVLDVGCGSGDVAFLCAALVGEAGELLGMDKAPAAVETARRRAEAAGLKNVTFAVGDPSEAAFEKPFDAVVGRLVLMHQPGPVAMLRKLASFVRAGGVIAFQEFDLPGARSFPPSPSFEKSMQWLLAAFTVAGTDTRMGVKLHAAFVEAGLPAPAMSLDAGIWGGENNPAAAMLAEVIRSLLPMIEKAGIATAVEVDVDSLRDRIQQELSAADSITIAPSLIGAWTKLP